MPLFIVARCQTRTRRAVSIKGIRYREFLVRGCFSLRGCCRLGFSARRPARLGSGGLLLIWLWLWSLAGLCHIHTFLRAGLLPPLCEAAPIRLRGLYARGKGAGRRDAVSGPCIGCGLLRLPLLRRRGADQVDGGWRGRGPRLGPGSQSGCGWAGLLSGSWRLVHTALSWCPHPGWLSYWLFRCA